MRGGYFSLEGLLVVLSGPPAVAVGGILVLTLGVIQTFEFSGVLMSLFALGFTFVGSLRKLDRTEQTI